MQIFYLTYVCFNIEQPADVFEGIIREMKGKQKHAHCDLRN